MEAKKGEFPKSALLHAAKREQDEGTIYLIIKYEIVLTCRIFMEFLLNAKFPKYSKNSFSSNSVRK